jgi:protein-tyrosine phosphatase
VSSAGTAALADAKMDPRVARRLSELGLHSDAFRARQLTADLVKSADLILAASRQHRSEIVRMEPSALRRTYALADFADVAAHLQKAAARSVLSLEPSEGTFVRRLTVTVARERGEVRARTLPEAEIVDPFRAPERVLERMFNQVDALLPAIVSVLVG